MITKSSSILGISPVTENTLKSINKFSLENKKDLMIICSRNQIECSSLGGGYFMNLDTEAFMKKIKVLQNSNPYLYVCRDHSGPYTADKKNKNFSKELDNTKKSLLADIQNSFDLIHIDTSNCGNKKLEILQELYDYCIENSLEEKKIYFEFGTTDHGEKFNKINFLETFNTVKDFKNGIFLTGSTGSLIRGIEQIGQLNIDDCKSILEIIKDSNFKIKDHNCDYLNPKDIKLRKTSGINAFNIGPELAIVESQQVIEKANKINLYNLTQEFIKQVIESKKWNKWCYKEDTENVKFLSSSHYFFTTDMYKEIYAKVSEEFDIESLITTKHFEIFKKFYI